MKKEDLKAGYLIKFDDDSLAMITYGGNGELCVSGKINWFPVSAFNEDLTYKDAKIIKIYGYASNCYAYKLETSDRKCIWERKEKPNLTEAERFILESIDSQYKYIARDDDGSVYVYGRKPFKDNHKWYNMGAMSSFKTFKHLFQFVKCEDEEPYLIADLLK